MSLSIPAALRSLAAAGNALAELAAWRRRARGDARALIGEIKNNLTYLDLVARDEVPLATVLDKIAIDEYQRLSRAGFDFNALKRARIGAEPSLEGTDLAAWSGKETEALVESIYDKIADLRIRHAHVGADSRYRWNVRVNNIRKRIWLLLRHVRSA